MYSMPNREEQPGPPWGLELGCGLSGAIVALMWAGG